MICLKRILKKLENKNSFKKKRDVLKTTQKYIRAKKNIQDPFNSNSDNKIMIVKAIEKANGQLRSFFDMFKKDFGKVGK